MCYYIQKYISGEKFMNNTFKKIISFLCAFIILSGMLLIIDFNAFKKSSIAEAGEVSNITSGKIYMLRNQATGKYMDVVNANPSDETRIQQYQYNATNAQKFRVIRIGDEFSTIFEIRPFVNLNSCVDICGGGNYNGTPVQIYHENFTSSQRFSIERVSEYGTYKILTQVSGYSRCITVASDDPNYNPVSQWDYFGHPSSHWIFEEAFGDVISNIDTNKVYFIRNQRSGLYMDVANNSVSNGTQIIQHPYTGNANQMFRIERTDSGFLTYDRIIPIIAEDMALNVYGDTDGSKVKLTPIANDVHQKFFIIRNSFDDDKSFLIHTYISGCITAEYASYNISDIIMWEYGYDGNLDNDHWFFEEAYVNFEDEDYLNSGEYKQYTFTFSDNKYYSLELESEADTLMTVIGYNASPIVVDNGGLGISSKDYLGIEGIKEKTIYIKVQIKNNNSGNFKFNIRKQQAVFYGFIYSDLNTTSQTQIPHSIINNKYNSFIFLNKNSSHVIAFDNRNIERINSEVVMLSGHGNSTQFSFPNEPLLTVFTGGEDLSRTKLIVWASCDSANNSLGDCLTDLSVIAGAQTALGFTGDIDAVSTKAFLDIFFTNLQTMSIYDAADISTQFPWTPTCAAYKKKFSGVSQNKYIFNPTINLNSITELDEQSLLNNFLTEKAVLSEAVHLFDNTYRYYKLINGLISNFYYDVTYNDKDLIINIKKGGILFSEQIIQNINIFDTGKTLDFIENNGDKLFLENIEILNVYYNFGDVLTPIEIKYNTYRDLKFGYSFVDVVCTNLFDGSIIDYEKIVTN